MAIPKTAVHSCEPFLLQIAFLASVTLLNMKSHLLPDFSDIYQRNSFFLLSVHLCHPKPQSTRNPPQCLPVGKVFHSRMLDHNVRVRQILLQVIWRCSFAFLTCIHGQVCLRAFLQKTSRSCPDFYSSHQLRFLNHISDSGDWKLEVH